MTYPVTPTQKATETPEASAQSDTRGPRPSWWHPRSPMGRRDPAHIQRWVAAMRAGHQREDIRCTAIAARTGERCCRLRMLGADTCHTHTRGPARDNVDTDRETRVQPAANHGRHRVKPEKVISTNGTISRRRLRLIWKRVNPNYPGATIVLDPHDEARVAQWLLTTHQIDLYGDDITVEAADSFRWAGSLFLAGRMDKPTADRCVASNRRRIARWKSRSQSSVES